MRSIFLTTSWSELEIKCVQLSCLRYHNPAYEYSSTAFIKAEFCLSYSALRQINYTWLYAWSFRKKLLITSSKGRQFNSANITVPHFLAYDPVPVQHLWKMSELSSKNPGTGCHLLRAFISDSKFGYPWNGFVWVAGFIAEYRAFYRV